MYERDTIIKSTKRDDMAMPHPYVVFPDVYEFIDVKSMHRGRKAAQASIIAEGLIDGKVVATFKRMPSTRPTNIKLSVDDKVCPLTADGSDIIKVVASVTDKNGNVKRMNNYSIRFEIEGEGEFVDNGKIEANPKVVKWGDAPILVRSTNKAGKIIVKAFPLYPGTHKLTPATIEFESVKSADKFIFTEKRDITKAQKASNNSANNSELMQQLNKLKKQLGEYKLKEVERQQSEFENMEK
jgi:beta-galactosidase